MSHKLEFVSTECLRPEVCIKAWTSLRENLTGVDWKKSMLYLNIDPLPKDKGLEEAKQIMQKARNVFYKVDVRRAKIPNFTRAVKWGWSQPRGSFFFYFQADWILKQKVDIEFLMMSMLNRKLDSLHLRAYKGNYDRLCLSPGLIKSNTARELAREMVETVGPEAQLRPPEKREGGRGLGVNLNSYCWPRNQVVVEDIGKEWAEKHNIQKKGGSSFVEWE